MTTMTGEARVSARARIVGWMLLLVGLALAASVFLTWSVLSARLNDRVNDELTHEANKLRGYVRTGIDPATGRTPENVSELLTGYLVHNLPDGYETFFSVVDGRAERRSAQEPMARLDRDAAFVARVARARTPVHGWADSPAGRVRYAVLPVRMAGDPRHAALVVVEFRDAQRAEVTETTHVLAITAFGALAVAGLVGWLIAGRVLAPIRLVRQTADQIGESDLTRRLEVRGNDDVAALATTFNRMLDRLESAFAVQRRFLDDAGHELRTPITVIRGHLELMGDDPVELEETRALLMEELDRMNRMVNDLLMLAKADRPDFLRLGEVDLADLTVDVVAKSRGLAQRRWRVAQVAEVRVLGDAQRLTQALMQLASNAVRHTGEGDTVEVGSAVRDGAVLLWVRDTGPGVAEEDAVRIFERFVRAGSGPRPPDGAGLGLAIVASIARAHGGTAYVESPGGGGARFVLDLPLRPVYRHPADPGPGPDLRTPLTPDSPWPADTSAPVAWPDPADPNPWPEDPTPCPPPERPTTTAEALGARDAEAAGAPRPRPRGSSPHPNLEAPNATSSPWPDRAVPDREPPRASVRPALDDPDTAATQPNDANPNARPARPDLGEPATASWPEADADPLAATSPPGLGASDTATSAFPGGTARDAYPGGLCGERSAATARPGPEDANATTTPVPNDADDDAHAVTARPDLGESADADAGSQPAREAAAMRPDVRDSCGAAVWSESGGADSAGGARGGFEELGTAGVGWAEDTGGDVCAGADSEESAADTRPGPGELGSGEAGLADDVGSDVCADPQSKRLR